MAALPPTPPAPPPSSSGGPGTGGPGPGPGGAAAAAAAPSSSSSGRGAPHPPPPPPPPPPSSSSGGGQKISHVSEAAYEFLLAEILHWVEEECAAESLRRRRKEQQAAAAASDARAAASGRVGDDPPPAETAQSREERAILSAERAAAKIERLGFDVGYRLCERLAQHKPLGPPPPPPGSAGGGGGGGAGGGGGGGGPDPSASAQLEAVKFLCKEFWTEVFRKQIDKLQTNHRGVFVLKDHELRWLRRLPPEDETARVAAIKMLAFPCGLIRGALSNLGIAAVVSCDFLADGKNMAACSFNIKVKS